MKLTQSKTIRDIVRPPIIGMPVHPSVEMPSSIIQAVELMLKNDVSIIAVTGRGRLLGHIRLSDALEYLGIQIPKNSSGTQKNGEKR